MDPQSMSRNLELEWSSSERFDLRERILNLRNNQIGNLLECVGLLFSDANRDALIAEIREFEHESVHLELLIAEAESKKMLLELLSEFEKRNFITDSSLEL